MTKNELLTYARAVKHLRNLDAQIRGYEDAELYSANNRAPTPLPYDHGNAVSPDVLAGRVQKRDEMQKRKEGLEAEVEEGVRRVLSACRVLNLFEIEFVKLRYIGKKKGDFPYPQPIEDFFVLAKMLGISRRKCFIVQRTILEKVAEIQV